MFSESKARSQFAWKEEDPYDLYQQFRPEWFHFTSQTEARNPHRYRPEERAPIIDIVHPAREDERQESRPRPFPTRSERSRIPFKVPFQEGFSSLKTLKRQWIDEELFFAMNKLSLLGLVIGLMFLGALFFLSGFLMAVNLYGIGAPKSAAQLASGTNPSHVPTPGYQSHQPSIVKGDHASVPSQYATMGGVSMVPQPRMPSNVQHKQVQQATYPAQGAAPSAPVHQYPQASAYPPQMPLPQAQGGYAYPAHAPASAAPYYNPASYPVAQPSSAPIPYGRGPF